MFGVSITSWMNVRLYSLPWRPGSHDNAMDLNERRCVCRSHQDFVAEGIINTRLPHGNGGHRNDASYEPRRDHECRETNELLFEKQPAS